MFFEDQLELGESYCKILHLEEEWNKLKTQLSDITPMSGFSSARKTGEEKTVVSEELQPKVAPKMHHEVSEGKIRSEKNAPAKGDDTFLECDTTMTPKSPKLSSGFNSRSKAIMKPTKQQVINKLGSDNFVMNNAPENTTRKRTMTQNESLQSLGALVEQSTRLQMKVQKDPLRSSVDSSINTAHKRPRQPKQKVGISSKVSSSEKQGQKKSTPMGKFKPNLILVQMTI